MARRSGGKRGFSFLLLRFCLPDIPVVLFPFPLKGATQSVGRCGRPVVWAYFMMAGNRFGACLCQSPIA